MLPAVPRVLEQLDEQDCRRLLNVASHGRLAFTEGALPMVLPVTYTVRGNDVIASLVGVEVDRVIRGAVVGFEVDSYDPHTQDGWCVSVIGPAWPITDPELVAELDALRFAPHTPDVTPGRQYVAIQIAVLRGRQLRVRPHQPAALSSQGCQPTGTPDRPLPATHAGGLDSALPGDVPRTPVNGRSLPRTHQGLPVVPRHGPGWNCLTRPSSLVGRANRGQPGAAPWASSGLRHPSDGCR